jgi:hypothetical protein
MYVGMLPRTSSICLFVQFMLQNVLKAKTWSGARILPQKSQLEIFKWDQQEKLGRLRRGKTRQSNTIEIFELEQVCLRRSCKRFFGKKACKKLALDKVTKFKGTIFQGPAKHLYTSQNRVEIS